MTHKPLWNRESLQSPHEVADKAVRVRSMFDAIAQRYQLTNTVCSAGRDAYWRRRSVKLAEVRTDDAVLDVACGTGDFARAFAKAGAASVTGCDFAHQMLIRASQSQVPQCRWIEGDALQLPFRDESFTLVTCAFGVRNFVELAAGLREMQRVLRPGGRLVVLEFSRPRLGIFRTIYELYAQKIMPVAASWISGDRSGAYRYLPRSVVSFVDTQQMASQVIKAGFRDVLAHPLTFGVTTVYCAKK